MPVRGRGPRILWISVHKRWTEAYARQSTGGEGQQVSGDEKGRQKFPGYDGLLVKVYPSICFNNSSTEKTHPERYQISLRSRRTRYFLETQGQYHQRWYNDIFQPSQTNSCQSRSELMGYLPDYSKILGKDCNLCISSAEPWQRQRKVIVRQKKMHLQFDGRRMDSGCIC